jgi:hypothetical protein
MWKPNRTELSLIADAGFGGQSPEKIAAALGITEAEFRAWSASLIATRTTPQATPTVPEAPRLQEQATPRIVANRLFEASEPQLDGV